MPDTSERPPSIDEIILWVRTTRIAVERGHLPEGEESVAAFVNGLHETEKKLTHLRGMVGSLASEILADTTKS